MIEPEGYRGYGPPLAKSPKIPYLLKIHPKSVKK
jgi:hypothetical protein